jgi:fumarate hydratase subunit beta
MAITLECRPTLDETASLALTAGDAVSVSGDLITIRDATAKRLLEIASSGQALPLDLTGRVLYAVGPSPAKPGQIVGSAGPTTIERFVAYLPFLFRSGVKGIIAKGELHGDIVGTFRDSGAVYLAAIGGLGALLGKRVDAAHIVAFPELGPEALHQFTVRDFPAVVIIDRHGGNFHETARARWRRQPRP